MFKLFKKDWKDYVDRIEKQKRSYLTHHAYERLLRWEKAISAATDYLDSHTDGLDAKQLELRRSFMQSQKTLYISESTKYVQVESRLHGKDAHGSRM